MRRSLRILAMYTLMVGAAACGGGGGDGGGSSGLQSALQGTWTNCSSYGNESDGGTLTFNGLSYTVTSRYYLNGTCTAPHESSDVFTGTITIGATVSVPFGGSTVSAYKVTSTDVGGTYYDLGYIDAASNPDRLYFGDSSGANDGSTELLRPTALDPSYYYTKQ